MKILHVIPSISLVFGGPSVAIREMVSYQNKAGITSHVLTAHQQAVRETTDFEAEHLISFRSYFQKYPYVPGFRSWLYKNISQYDMVHIHGLFRYSTFIAALAAIKNSKPYIIRPIGQLYPWSLKNKSRLLKKLYLTLIDQKLIENADSIHFTTQHERNNLAVKLKNIQKSFVLPLGVISHQSTSSSPLGDEKLTDALLKVKNKKKLLFLGRIHPKKGVHLLVEWSADLLREHPDWVLIIAGSGEANYINMLRGCIELNGLQDRVLFVGEARNGLKWRLLKTADIFVLPSYSENFAIAAAEAMMAGLPLLISDQVGLADDAARADCCSIFGLQKEEFLKAARYLLNSDQARQLMSKRAFEYACNHYDWNRITQEQIKIYDNILNGVFMGGRACLTR